MRAFALFFAGLLIAGSVVAPPARAVDTRGLGQAPDLASVRAKIAAEDFQGAIAELTPLLDTHQHADVYNLLGFSYRKTGDREQAFIFYAKALDFDPRHKGALEYQGELFVETGQIDKARQNLVQLKQLCADCEELEDLKKAIAAAPTN